MEHPAKVLSSLDFTPKKKRGQSFLADPNIARKIVEHAACDDEFIVEVGPGLGALTSMLAGKARAVKAVEIEKTLADYLQDRVRGTGVEVVRGDFLRLKEDIFASWSREAGGKVKIIGNLPYSISGPLIFRFVELREYLKGCYVMLQREVARRIASSPGGREYGVPSVILQAVSRVHILFSVSRNCFYPVPDVDSSFLEIDFAGAGGREIKDFNAFSKMVHAAFSGRRKVIRNALQRHLGSCGVKGKENLDRLFDEAGIRPGDRPERVSVDHFVKLANLIG